MEDIVTPATIAYQVIAALCDTADYKCTTLDDGSLRVDAATPVFIRLSPKHDRMQVATYRQFADELDPDGRQEFLNTLNKDSQLLKASLSQSGALRLSYEHYLEGGVTAGNLLAVVQRIAVLCTDLMIKYRGNFK